MGWTKGILGPLKRRSGEFRGDNREDQGDSGATMWWTRGIRSTQARTGWIKVRACADLEGEDPSKHGPEKERLEEAQTWRARI